MKKFQVAFGLALLAAALVRLFIPDYGFLNTVALSIIVFSLIGVYYTIGSGNKWVLFLLAALFNGSILALVLNNNEILEKNLIYFPSFLITLGAGFLMIFFDDTGKRTNLLAAVIFYLLGALSFFFGKSSGILNYFNSMAASLLGLFPILVIIGIIIFLLRRSKGKNNP